MGPLLARAGFLAMAINYRLSAPGRATWPGNLEDVGQALSWLVRHAFDFRIDPHNIGIIGESAGGHLGALATLLHYTRSPLLPALGDGGERQDVGIGAMLGVYGVYDVAPPPGEEQRDLYTLAIPEMLGATQQEAPEVYRQASASTYIMQAAMSPQFKTRFLFTWGDSDEVVPPSVSSQFAQRLAAARAEVRTLIIPGAGHYWMTPMRDRPGGTLQDYPNTVFAPQAIAFLREALTPPVALT